MKICLLGSPVESCQEFAKTLGVKFFKPDYLTTVGCNFTTIKMKVDNMNFLLQLWIINPSSRFRATRSMYIRDTQALLILFDTQDHQSFQSAEQLLQEARKNVLRPISSVPITLVGTQSDTEMITTEEAQTLADKYNMHYYEINLNDSSQTVHIMTELIRQLVKKYEENLSSQRLEVER